VDEAEKERAQVVPGHCLIGWILVDEAEKERAQVRRFFSCLSSTVTCLYPHILLQDHGYVNTTLAMNRTDNNIQNKGKWQHLGYKINTVKMSFKGKGFGLTMSKP
jgi:hypothetical protein